VGGEDYVASGGELLFYDEESGGRHVSRQEVKVEMLIHHEDRNSHHADAEQGVCFEVHLDNANAPSSPGGTVAGGMQGRNKTDRWVDPRQGTARIRIESSGDSPRHPPGTSAQPQGPTEEALRLAQEGGGMKHRSSTELMNLSSSLGKRGKLC
jgi:hypothetical protein